MEQGKTVNEQYNDLKGINSEEYKKYIDDIEELKENVSEKEYESLQRLIVAASESDSGLKSGILSTIDKKIKKIKGESVMPNPEIMKLKEKHAREKLKKKMTRAHRVTAKAALSPELSPIPEEKTVEGGKKRKIGRKTRKTSRKKRKTVRKK